MVAVIASTSTDTVPGDELEVFEAITLACSIVVLSRTVGASSGRSLGRPSGYPVGANGSNGGERCSLSGWSFSRRNFLEKRLLKLVKINKTETINSTSGDTNIPREPLLSVKLLSTWERQFKIYIA